MKQMFLKTFEDGVLRRFTIQRESYDWFVLEDEAGERWRVSLPNVVRETIRKLKEDRKISSPVGFSVVGHMPGGQRSSMRWVVS